MKRLIIVIILLVFVSVGWFLLSKQTEQGLSAEEKNAALTKMLDRSPILDAKGEQSWKTYHGEQLSFVYPANATIKQEENDRAKQKENVLDSFAFSLPQEHLSVVIQAVFHPDSIDAVSGFVLRNRQPEVYTKQERSVADEKGVVFTKEEDGIEKVVFVKRGTILYTFALTGQGADKKRLFDQLIESVRFN